jgi:hypothetical protein
MGIPKFMTRGTSKKSVKNSEQSNSSSEQSMESMSFEAPKQENAIATNSNDNGGIISDIILPSPESPQMNVSNMVQQPIVDEEALKVMVARAIDPFQNELARMQDTISDVRGEISSIKSNIQDLTLTFETSLTDLKAFQAEIANPLNFMRKYFDSLDIKNLSDPAFPLHAEQPLVFSGNNFNGDISSKESDEKLEHNSLEPTNSNLTTSEMPKQKEEIQIKQEFPESLPFNQLFSGNITLGKLMTTTTVLEEILQSVDRSSIDILIEQCKLMGLKPEDEHVIYNIINLMDQSGLSVKEILIMLYKFGKVMGIADKEADLVYAKLMMNQGKPHGSVMTVESKGN